MLPANKCLMKQVPQRARLHNHKLLEELVQLHSIVKDVESSVNPLFGIALQVDRKELHQFPQQLAEGCKQLAEGCRERGLQGAFVPGDLEEDHMDQLEEVPVEEDHKNFSKCLPKQFIKFNM